MPTEAHSKSAVCPRGPEVRVNSLVITKSSYWKDQAAKAATAGEYRSVGPLANLGFLLDARPVRAEIWNTRDAETRKTEAL